MVKTAPKILECTLRDGSYAINFQFTTENTRTIAGKLDALGFPLIEVGHGVGLGASEKMLGVAAATDAEYMKAASEAVKDNEWGMFCIPGIANLDHIRLAADHGMDFIRVGTDIADIEDSEDFIALAQSKGISVYSNLMKSYACSPEEFCNRIELSIGYGTDFIYIVDSAGGMLPVEIERYVYAVRNKFPDAQLGFHGHNNIGMGVANALHCADIGVQVVDTSLQGFGRSAGNTPTEQFISALIRAGYEVGYDPIDVMQVGEESIRPLIRNFGISSLDLTAGLSLFHTSYMKRVLGTAERYRVDPRRLIVALCEKDIVNAPEDLLEQLASEISDRFGPLNPIVLNQYFGEEQR